MTTRTRLSLDGQWQFRHQDDDSDSWRAVTVPGPWQAQFEDLRLTSGEAVYRCRIQVKPSLAAGSTILHFGAVDYYAQIWLNGSLVGEHSGGYLPFEFDVANLLSADGQNQLEVRVKDPSALTLPGVDGTFADIPHGKQSWYGPLSGIWQSVWLEARPRRHISRVKITPDGVSGQVELAVCLNQPMAPHDRIHVEILSPAGVPVASTEAAASTLQLALPDPQLWDLDTPHLYTARITLRTPIGEDAVQEQFGFRTIETRDGQILLNGRPIYLRGALDQDYYPDLIYTPPSIDYIEAQFRQAKEMGLNCMRIHIKVGDPRYYEAADRLGMLIWTELPNWGQLTEAAKASARETLAGMIERDWNHPSIIIWTIINEAWGTELATNPDHRAWLAEMVPWVKELDPTRLVVDNSPCFPNFHVLSDLDDFHYYAAMPAGAHRWDAFLEGFASRAEWLYAPEYQHNRKSDTPLIVSEFGNWGLPDIGPLRQHYQGDPWWFETGWDWGGGDVYPHRAGQRFYDLHLDKVFGDYAGLARASQWAQFEAMQYEIEQMRLHRAITGYVITEWTDLHWECNGLLDMLRRPKAYYQRLAEINADTMIIPQCRRSLRAGEELTISLALSHFGRNSITGARLTAVLSGHGVDERRTSQDGIDIETAAVRKLNPLQFTLPRVTVPTRVWLDLLLESASGRPLARSGRPLTLFPPQTIPAVKLATPDEEFAAELTGAGYGLVHQDDLGAMRVVTVLRDDDRRFVEQGGKVLFLAEKPEALQTNVPRLSLQARQGNAWAGDWASTFSWIRRDLWAADLPGDGRLDFTFETVIPETVISSARTGDFEREVLTGLFVGWLRRPVALVQQMPVGRGQLLISTLRLRHTLPMDPIAQSLFHALLAHLLDSDGS